MLDTRVMKDIVEFDYMMMDAIGDLVLKLSEDVYEGCFEDYIRFAIKYALIMSDFAGRYPISSYVVEYIEKTDICETRLIGLHSEYENVLRNVDKMEALSCTRVNSYVLRKGDALYNVLDECLLSLMHGNGSEHQEKALFNKVKGLYRDLMRSAMMYGKSYFKEKDDCMFFLYDEKAFEIEDGEVYFQPEWEKKIEHSVYYDKYIEYKNEYENEGNDIPFKVKMEEEIKRFYQSFIEDIEHRSDMVEKCLKEKEKSHICLDRIPYVGIPENEEVDKFERLVEFGEKFLDTFAGSEYMEGTYGFLCGGWRKALRKVEHYKELGNGVIRESRKKTLINLLKHLYLITEPRMREIEGFDEIRIKDVWI